MIAAAVLDRGGTPTAWHDVDFHAESFTLAQAVVGVDHEIEVQGVAPRSARPPARDALVQSLAELPDLVACWD